MLRTTPVLVDVAGDVLDVASDAFFFNDSNPMTANVMAVSRGLARRTWSGCATA